MTGVKPLFTRTSTCFLDRLVDCRSDKPDRTAFPLQKEASGSVKNFSALTRNFPTRPDYFRFGKLRSVFFELVTLRCTFHEPQARSVVREMQAL
jgi:hypothetical protein